MTDEELLKLARECGAHQASGFGCYVAMRGERCFTQTELLTYSREIERRALEGAAEKCDEWGEAVGVHLAAEIRAMIKE